MTGTLGRGLGKADMFAEMESKLLKRRALAEGQPGGTDAGSGSTGGEVTTGTPPNVPKKLPIATPNSNGSSSAGKHSANGSESPRTSRRLDLLNAFRYFRRG